MKVLLLSSLLFLVAVADVNVKMDGTLGELTIFRDVTDENYSDFFRTTCTDSNELSSSLIGKKSDVFK